jgi:hypothetical protein
MRCRAKKVKHQPLNRQAERYAKEGVPISLSTLADQVGGCTAALVPLFKRLEAYVLTADRLHGDDTRVPVLAKGKTDTGRIWVYVGPAPPGGGVLLLGATGPASIPRRMSSLRDWRLPRETLVVAPKPEGLS